MQLIKNKKIIIVFSLIVIGIIGGLMWLNRDSATNQPSVRLSPTPYFLPDNTYEEIPSNQIIEVGGVAVNNFFNLSESTNPKVSAEFVHTDSYTIEYQNRFNKFLILITGSPFFRYRILAENALVEALGIERGEACKLNVEISTPHFANPNEAGNVYGLSFCNQQ